MHNSFFDACVRVYRRMCDVDEQCVTNHSANVYGDSLLLLRFFFDLLPPFAIHSLNPFRNPHTLPSFTLLFYPMHLHRSTPPLLKALPSL